MDHFMVVNWGQHQHYKNRNPTWIKLSTSLADDYHYSGLSDQGKLVWLSVLILAAKNGNKIPLDPVWIQHRACLGHVPDLQPLFDCGFIEAHPASKTLLNVPGIGTQKEREERKKEQDDQKVVSEEERAKNRARFGALRETARGKLASLP